MAALVTAASGAVVGAEPASHHYQTSFDTIVHLSGDLHRALERKPRAELQPAPILIEQSATPYLQTRAAATAGPMRAIYISCGLVDLMNFVSHAKAIDAEAPGFLAKAVAGFSLEADHKHWPELPAGTMLNPWSSAVMNRQASHFNQMAGALVAIQMAHLSLGHYQKYSAQLGPNANDPVPINRVLTPGEWRKAVRQGAHQALDCGLAIEGLTVLFETIDQMPTRPAWRIYFAPDTVDLGKVARELSRSQRRELFGFQNQQPALGARERRLAREQIAETRGGWGRDLAEGDLRTGRLLRASGS